MKEKDCRNCIEYKRCKESYFSWLFFVIGLIATIAIRVVTVLIHIDPLYAKIAWYIGVGGFFVFFVYKFRINSKRAELVRRNKLLSKVQYKGNFAEEDLDLIGAILCSLSSRKERINYFFIFILSAVALFVAIYFDFIR